MAKFQDLPNELLTELWRCILPPKDVESFSMVSKHIRLLGSSALQEHRRLTRLFESTEHFWKTFPASEQVERMSKLSLKFL